MQPHEITPAKASVIDLLSRTGKRKLPDSRNSQPESSQSAARRASNTTADPDTIAAAIPTPKRIRRSNKSEPSEEAQRHSMSSIKNRPAFVDLTKPSNFQPHTGARRLAIKNLRKTPLEDVELYYQKTWDELDAALTRFFEGVSPSTPLGLLSQGVEATCRRGKANKLFEHLRQRFRANIEQSLLPRATREGGSQAQDCLRAVQSAWELWRDQLLLIGSIFSYLDRSYLLNTKDLPLLGDMGIDLFREIMFEKDGELSTLGSRAIDGICEQVNYDRDHLSTFDPKLLRAFVATLHILGIYAKYFEKKFQNVTRKYIEQFADDRTSFSLSDYVAATDALLERESTRCDKFNFDSITRRTLQATAHRTLVEERSVALLDTEKVSKLLEQNAVESLRTLYRLLSLSNLQQRLQDPWAAYMTQVGSAIVKDVDKVDQMVIRLLELKKAQDIVIRDAFNKDELFTRRLRESFGKFLNDKENTQAFLSGNPIVGEMIAKYLDTLLRGGLKAVPRSLLSDSTERDDAEKRGQSSTGDEDAELDRQLDQGLELFRFIVGKDVFEAFYKKDLARRLLMNRSASKDAERSMLAKLKIECGSSFTHNLEQMFKDQYMARDEMVTYKDAISAEGGKPAIDLEVTVLSNAAWPSYRSSPVKLPAIVANQLERYNRHYTHKHTGRVLTWKHALAHSVVKARFKDKDKELLVSGFQAIVLILFNDIGDGGNLSYAALSLATGLEDAELSRTLQSLACAKVRVLTKHPKGRDVNPTDTFTVNLGFTDPKYRIKINQIQLKETKAENVDTHSKIKEDRQYETQAAIVRIMKSRKIMTHSELVAEVISQTRSRGAVEIPEIKMNIEKLLEKDYMERQEGGSYTYQA